MKNILFLTALCFLSFKINAQQDIVNERLKVYYEKDSSDFYVNNGYPHVLVTNERIKKTKNTKWKFEFLNNDNYPEKGKEIILYKRTRLREVVSTKNEAYAVFLTEEKLIKIFKITPLSVELHQGNLDFLGYNDFSSIAVLNDQVLLFLHKQDAVISIDLKTDIAKEIPLNLRLRKRMRVNFSDFQYDNYEESAYLVLNLRRNRRNRAFTILKFNDGVEVSETFRIIKGGTLSFSDFSIFQNEKEEYFISGSYNTHYSRKVPFGGHFLNVLFLFLSRGEDILFTYDESVTDGLFLSKFSEGKRDFLKFYYHTRLDKYQLDSDTYGLDKMKKRN